MSAALFLVRAVSSINTSNFALDFGLYGLPFSTGIALCNSSLGLTKAIGAVDCFFNTTYI